MVACKLMLLDSMICESARVVKSVSNNILVIIINIKNPVQIIIILKRNEM